MIKLLIGGSPCTHWSIAQSKNRETKAEGVGWELFENYVIAKEKFQPDFFLYENNWSASREIKEQIQEELGCELMRINSRLVSAQNRDRFYVFNWDVEQLEDKGILLRDVLETGEGYNPTIDGKSHTITASYYKMAENLGSAFGCETGRQRVIEPIRVGTYPTESGELKGGQGQRIYSIDGKSVVQTANGGGQGAKTGLYAVPCAGRVVGRKINERGCRDDYNPNIPAVQRFEINDNPDKTNCLTTVTKDNVIAEPVAVNLQAVGKKKNENGEWERSWEARTDSKSSTVTQIESHRMVAEPLRVPEATAQGYVDINPGECVDLAMEHSKTRRGRKMGDKANCLTTTNGFYEYCGTVDKPIYEVRDGMITIKDKVYPIKLRDGYYIIRKLTPVECERLQTMPDGYTEYGAVENNEANYSKYKTKLKKDIAWVREETNQICFPVAITNRYKGLGNGWTAEVIISILHSVLKDVPQNEKIVVLSMYDGIGTGRYCLDKMGFTNVEYHAYEIDENAKAIAMYNYPDIIQHGDAFQLREDDWKL